MTDAQNPDRPEDDIDPQRAAQVEQARKALDRKTGAAPDPRFGTRSSDEGAQERDVNETASVEGSAEIGGHPAAVGRSHGVRKGDQG